MQILFYDARGENGVICPHILIVRDSNNNILYEFYAKPNPNNEITTLTVPDNSVYTIELINPNLFESNVVRAYTYWNNITQSIEPVTNQVTVTSGQNNILTINGSNINNNILLNTSNFGTNNSNIVSSVIGSVPIRGIDLDGNSLAGNEEIFSKLNFKKNINNQISTFTIDNKRLRRGIPNGTLVNGSVYIPYLISYFVTVNLVTPILSVSNGDTLEWTNPQTPKESNKRFEIYKDNVLFSTRDSITPSTSNSIFIDGLLVGSFKIRYSLDNITFSDFSNSISLNPNTSATPTITTHTNLDINSNGTITLNAQPNASIYKTLSGQSEVLLPSKTDITTGNLVVNVTTAGNYTFRSKIDGAVISNNSVIVDVLSNQNNCIGITNLLINKKAQGETPNSNRTIGYTYSGSVPISKTWQINGQGVSIVSGEQTDYPEFHFGNSNGFITLTVVDCTGATIQNIYNFTLNNLVTPNITKINETTINWNNDADTSLHIKTIRVYDQNDVLQNELINKSGSDNIYVSSGSHKIKYSTNGVDFSSFSNLIVTTPATTVLPIIAVTPTNGQINTDGTQSAVFTITNYITNSRIDVCKDDTVITSINQNTYSTNQIGNYCFIMAEDGKLKSDRTSNIPISYIPSATLCNNGTNLFSILSSSYDYLTNKLTFVFNASSLTSATWKIKLGQVVIESGVITSFTSSTKTITTSTNLQNNNYVFELTGVSCTGVATSNLIVSNVPDNKCVFTNTTLLQDTLIVNLINFKFDCNILLDVLTYDLLDAQNNILLTSQTTSTPVLISGNTYKSQLDFSEVTEGVYSVNIKYSKLGVVCNVVIPFTFVLQDSDITTGELNGTDVVICDFTQLQLNQTINTNSIVASFNSAIPLTNIVYDISNLTGIINSNITTVFVSYVNNIYTVKLDFASLITGNYSVKLKANNCEISKNILFTKFVPLPDNSNVTVAPTINFNYDTSRVEFLSNCSDGIVKIYVNNLISYEPITKTTSGFLYSALMFVNNNDQLKVTVECPNKLVSVFSNTVILIADSCMPINKSNIASIHGNNTATVNSQSNYSLVMDEFRGGLPFNYETTVIGGTIVSGLNTSNLIVKFGNSQQAIINYKILNCNNTHFVELTKLITISPEIIVIVPNVKPKIVSIINGVLTGISTPNVYVNLYNENNDLIYSNIKTDSNGKFTAIVKKYKAYYTRIIVGSGLSDIGNIYVITNTSSCTSKCNII